MYIIKFCVFLFGLYSFSSALANPSSAVQPEANSSSAPRSNIHYGQIFMEETKSRGLSSYELSISGGGELSSPYINSSFFGMEIKHRVHSFGHLGLEYMIHASSPTLALEVLRNKMSLYGFEMTYPFLKYQAYINWHYTFFQSHVNLVSLLRLSMAFPLQVGVGVMNMEQKNTHLSFKWGIGPQIYLSRRWALQLLISQSVSFSSPHFLYTWYSVKFIYGI